MARHHLIISGTGRAGTTFLVELFTHLGLDTGFKPEELHLHLDKRARAGLERDVREEGSPYVVKSPFFCDHAEEVFQRRDLVIDHILVPMRDLRAAAQSRQFVTAAARAQLPPWQRIAQSLFRAPVVPGGLWKTHRTWKQERVLMDEFYKLLLAAAATAVPVTLLRYPRLVQDATYLFEKLRPVLGTISAEQFGLVFKRTARPELTHSFNSRDR